MSWLDAIIPRIKRGRKGKGKAAGTVPEGIWLKCKSCQAPIFERDLVQSLGVCPKCSHHHHITPRKRAESLFDPDTTIEEVGSGLRPRDFLKFVDSKPYAQRLKDGAAEEADKEAARVFLGTLNGAKAVACCFDWSFMGGSMGSVVGERFARGVDVACDRGVPFMCFASSGGARMQEGLTSLMQMAKTTAAQAKLAERKLPFISILCHPTTGGVAASFALNADIVIAEPGATIGFAGERVIRSTVREELPEGFQRSEFLLRHGSVDMVVDRRNMRDTLIALTSMLMEGRGKADQ